MYSLSVIYMFHSLKIAFWYYIYWSFIEIWKYAPVTRHRLTSGKDVLFIFTNKCWNYRISFANFTSFREISKWILKILSRSKMCVFNQSIHQLIWKIYYLVCLNLSIYVCLYVSIRGFQNTCIFRVYKPGYRSGTAYKIFRKR